MIIGENMGGTLVFFDLHCDVACQGEFCHNIQFYNYSRLLFFIFAIVSLEFVNAEHFLEVLFQSYIYMIAISFINQYKCFARP